MQQALKVAQAQIEGAMDKGFHRHIRQTDLKLFWRTFFEGWKVGGFAGAPCRVCLPHTLLSCACTVGATPAVTADPFDWVVRAAK